MVLGGELGSTNFLSYSLLSTRDTKVSLWWTCTVDPCDGLVFLAIRVLNV